MKRVVFLIAIAALVLSVDTPLTTNRAIAASARCAAFCNGWCAKNRARRNLESCSDYCQLKHCH